MMSTDDMTSTNKVRWGALLLLSVAACASSTVPPPRDSGSDVTPDATPDAPVGGPCPATIPAEGSPCAREGLVCGYGDDPRVQCHPRATCTNGAWTWQRTNCPGLPPTSCPPTRAMASGQQCTPRDAFCGYEGIPCRCTNCVFYPIERCDGPLTWHCEAPNTTPGCPAAIPNLGTTCTAEGLQCGYGCEPGMARTCRSGVWTESSTPGGCPISTRQVKRDIEYLNPAEVDRLAREVAATRLATYEYTLPALAGRRRLGFILEDQPASYASDPAHSQVDLYGYTSLLVAAVQSQSRQIEALRREVDDLRRQRAR